MKQFKKKLEKIFDIISIWALIILGSIIYFSYGYYCTLIKYTSSFNQVGSAEARLDNVAIVNYAGGDVVQFFNRDLLNKSAHDHGIDRIFTYSPSDISKEYYQAHKEILSQKRGAGYWLWKPYIILDAMKRLPENDFIIYLDGDTTILRDISPLIELAKKHDRVLFYNWNYNRNYIKRDAYILMDCDKKECYNAKHLAATFIIFKNSKKNQEFVKLWQKYSEDPRIITDQANKLGTNFPDFKDHRHEQAILSLLSLRYGVKDQIIVSFDDRKKFFSKDESKNPLLVWLYNQSYYEHYLLNDSSGPYETKELESLRVK